MNSCKTYKQKDNNERHLVCTECKPDFFMEYHGIGVENGQYCVNVQYCKDVNTSGQTCDDCQSNYMFASLTTKKFCVLKSRFDGCKRDQIPDLKESDKANCKECLVGKSMLKNGSVVTCETKTIAQCNTYHNGENGFVGQALA